MTSHLDALVIPRRAVPFPVFLLASTILLLLAGCEILGIAANAFPPPNIEARYKGLRDQSVAVMVWADPGVRIDFPGMRLAIASSLQSKLQQAKKKNQHELQNTRFPHAAASVLRLQDDHPELEALRITEVAPRVGVDRLIYIEVNNFQTRSNEAIDLYRGSLTASLKVVEVAGGKGKVVYEEASVTAIFPRKAPPEGVQGANDGVMYRGTVEAFTTEVAKRFISHPPEE